MREVDGRFLFGDLDPLDLFELLDARLHLLRLGRLARKRLMKASSASMRSRWFLYADINCVRRSSFWVRYFS